MLALRSGRQQHGSELVGPGSGLGSNQYFEFELGRSGAVGQVLAAVRRRPGASLQPAAGQPDRRALLLRLVVFGWRRKGRRPLTKVDRRRQARWGQAEARRRGRHRSR